MINIILPNFYYFSAINEDLIKMYKQHKNYFYSDQIKFLEQEGNFPYMYWSSSFVNKGTILYQHMNKYISDSNCAFIFDCANPLLQEKDLNDPGNNTYLKLGENGSNKILISSYSILSLLKQKYPQYKFIGSEYFIATDPELSHLDELTRIKVFYKNDDILKKIPINKTEIVLNNPCETCIAAPSCFLEEWSKSYLYSTKRSMPFCPKIKPFDTNWTIIEKLNKKGYQYFSFNLNYLELHDLDTVKQIYINLFIKEEYKNQANIFLRR